MRLVFIVLFTLIDSVLHSQSWQSINKQGTYEVTPYTQFSIDPYTNKIWLIHDEHVAVIENDGNILEFDQIDLGTLWVGAKLFFTFTPNHVYFVKKYYGLYCFDNYFPIQEDTLTDFVHITSNADSVYIVVPNENFRIYIEPTMLFSNYGGSSVSVKNSFLYADFGSNSYPVYFDGPNGGDFVPLLNDPEYLGGVYNEKKFTRLTDTIYFAFDNGISKAHNYDFFDTITPFNTTNMPSGNVLEMEFDENDSLWAVFGDGSDVPFAIAKLDGNTWTNEINAGNSPIDFNNFYGFEIDTLGNLWIVDNNSLHTLIGPNSPNWLGINDVKTEFVNIYPNPAKTKLVIDGLKGKSSVDVCDLNGRILKNFELNSKQIDVSFLPDGIYLINIKDENGEYTHRFIKE